MDANAYGTHKDGILGGMLALRRGAVEISHEDFMDAIQEVQAKKKMSLQYYA